jgi:alkylation response protein AidB-like acyl-CoA dehydrogenase
MDFHFSAQEEAFRQEVRTWLAANMPPSHTSDAFEERSADERFDLHLAWQKQLHTGNWVGIHWPKAYGGRGATILEQVIYAEEMGRVHAPGIANALGVMLVGPTLIHWGTEEQKQRFIPKILSAEEIWCQGYSEPGSGSDLASLQTRAVEDGDFLSSTARRCGPAMPIVRIGASCWCARTRMRQSIRVLPISWWI